MPIREFTITSTASALIGADLTMAAIRLRDLAQSDEDRALVENLNQSRDRLRKFDAAPQPTTCRIKYEIHQDDLHSRGEIELPSWCEGSPREAIALHFFGYVVGIVHAVTRAEVV